MLESLISYLAGLVKWAIMMTLAMIKRVTSSDHDKFSCPVLGRRRSFPTRPTAPFVYANPQSSLGHTRRTPLSCLQEGEREPVWS